MGDKVIYVEQLNFSLNEVIFREGSPGGCMFSVDAGCVGIFSDYGAQQRLLKKLGPGSYFGEMGMVRGLPRSATAVSLDVSTTVSVINWDTLGLYFKDSPAKVVGIMQQLGQRVHELSDDYIEACGVITDLVMGNRMLRERVRVLEAERTSLQRKAGIQPDDKQEQIQTQLRQDAAKEEERCQKYLETYRQFVKNH